jgi:hypothetical protein
MRRISDVANNDAITKGLENASYCFALFLVSLVLFTIYGAVYRLFLSLPRKGAMGIQIRLSSHQPALFLQRVQPRTVALSTKSRLGQPVRKFVWQILFRMLCSWKLIRLYQNQPATAISSITCTTALRLTIGGAKWDRRLQPQHPLQPLLLSPLQPLKLQLRLWLLPQPLLLLAQPHIQPPLLLLALVHRLSAILGIPLRMGIRATQSILCTESHDHNWSSGTVILILPVIISLSDTLSV